MENELKGLGDREGHDSHLTEKFQLDVGCYRQSYRPYRVAIWLSLLGKS